MKRISDKSMFTIGSENLIVSVVKSWYHYLYSTFLKNHAAMGRNV